MKILSISAQKPNSTGSGTYLTELVNNFKLLNNEQAVIAGIAYEDKISLPQNVKFYPVHYNSKDMPFPVLGMSDSMPYESTRYKDLTYKMQMQFEEAFVNATKKAIDEFKPDLIICHHLYFLTAILREHFPNENIVGISHGTDLRQLKKINLQNDRIIKNIKNLNHIFALHEEQKEEIANLFAMPKDKITVIGSGYNGDVFYNKNTIKNNNIKKVIYAGKICEKKGVLSLLKSVEMINAKYEFELLLAGGYSDENEYENINNVAESSPVEVKFLGKLNQRELADYFNESDVFVLPSFFEGLPLVLIEALACGLKTVSTDLPGVKNWIDKHISNNHITFVTPPKMKNVDQPFEDELPTFEKNLAKALEDKINEDNFNPCDTTNATWLEVCKKIIKA